MITKSDESESEADNQDGEAIRIRIAEPSSRVDWLPLAGSWACSFRSFKEARSALGKAWLGRGELLDNAAGTPETRDARLC
jgi:hypothetical protein